MGIRRPHILAAAARGDREALAELFRSHQAPLLRYLRARRIADYDDVASDVWVDVARSIDRFDGDLDDFRRWLFTIAHRRSVDAVRRAVRRTERIVDPFDARHVGIDGEAPAADVEHDRRDAVDRALAIVATLPDNLAEAVMLRVVFELPTADVAAVMETTEGNVRVLVHRGLERLRRRFPVTDSPVRTMRVVS